MEQLPDNYGDDICKYSTPEYLEFLNNTIKLEDTIRKYTTGQNFNTHLQKYGIDIDSADSIYKNLLISKILTDILNPNIIYLIK